VLISISKGTRDVDTSKLYGLTARHNYFSQGDPGGALSHADNGRDFALRKRSGWRSIASIDDVDWEELARIARSSRVDGATAADQN
jgi:hypothetical protein